MPRIAQLPIYNNTETQRPQDEKKERLHFFHDSLQVNQFR